jgi:hypothetical protein
MQIDAVIALLIDENPEASIGATARIGSDVYDRLKQTGARFQRCECSYRAYRHGEYDGYDFITRTDRGAVYYVGFNRKQNIISCGQKGFHYQRGDSPACVG